MAIAKMFNTRNIKTGIAISATKRRGVFSIILSQTAKYSLSFRFLDLNCICVSPFKACFLIVLSFRSFLSFHFFHNKRAAQPKYIGSYRLRKISVAFIVPPSFPATFLVFSQLDWDLPQAPALILFNLECAYDLNPSIPSSFNFTAFIFVLSQNEYNIN